MSASVKQTMDDARGSMASFSENMDALKRNFLLRGYFHKRGYFDLAQISPADYRQGVLTRGAIVAWSASGFDPMRCSSRSLATRNGSS